MMLLAILLPFLSFIIRGKVITGIVCLILQITLIGWLPAAIWAVLSLNNERADKRNDKLIKAMRKNQK
ncbi:YqaE/Pmp3 family membrane protein [Chryseobacterium sp. KBW03]|nr:YqaE/Pmp3 family membrane protein [Chryseobacterium sp. KBW03]